jgi:hypothetical protein
LARAQARKVLPTPVGPQISTFWWSPTQRPGHQAGEQGPVEATRMAEIDILRRRRLFQPGPFQAGGVLPGFALGQFAVNEQAEALLEGELANVGLLGLAGQSLGHAGQAELMQLVDGRVMKHRYFLSGQW